MASNAENVSIWWRHHVGDQWVRWWLGTKQLSGPMLTYHQLDHKVHISMDFYLNSNTLEALRQQRRVNNLNVTDSHVIKPLVFSWHSMGQSQGQLTRHCEVNCPTKLKYKELRLCLGIRQYFVSIGIHLRGKIAKKRKKGNICVYIYIKT